MSNWRRFWISLAVLVLVGLVPLGSLALVPADTSDLTTFAQQAAKEFDRLMQLRQQQVFTMAALPSIRAFAASAPEDRSQRAAVALNELQAWVASDRRVREALITDTSGTIIMTTLEGWNSTLAERAFVRQTLAGGIAVSPIARDRGEFSQYYAAPVLNNRGEVAGALVARVAAQELWDVTPRGDTWYAVLVDENGVRLDDSGDPSRRLVAFAPLDTARAVQVVNARTYGAEMPQVRATTNTRAQELITHQASEQLSAADLGAGAFASARLVTKPWVVMVLAAAPTPIELAGRLALPVLAAPVLALLGAFVLARV